MLALLTFSSDPLILTILAILKIPGYFLVMRKMQLNNKTAVLPFLAEREMSKVLFRRMRTFYRPFIISVVFLAGALYLDPSVGMGRIYMLIAVIVYGWFLVRLYWRLGQSFGKGIIYRILLILSPALFMFILGVSKAEYTPLKFKPLKQYPKVIEWLLRGLVAVISAAEIVALVAVVGIIAIRVQMPGPLIEWQLDELYEKTKNIKGTDEVITRDDMMGEAAASVGTMKASREKFFPDHSQDKSVVVLTYIVGADLEDHGGYASANIRQMTESTYEGDALTYVVQAGGSKRWFTPGIDNATYGRYEIKGGKLKEVESLSDDMCMSDKKTLEDFLLWAKDKYKADRYMLVLWDHGGGVAMGYGIDALNEREKKSESDYGSINTSDVVEAVKKSGITFDLIGFDACLMQDIEVAKALEPYTDYFLASEEVEGGYGWYYTSGFGKLAADPGMSTEDFAVDMLSCYDQLNTIVKDEGGKPDTGATLSLVDTTMAKPAYEEFEKFLDNAGDKLVEDPEVYADMAVAGTNAYNFNEKLQIDLIDYLKTLNKADYDEDIASEEKMKALINRIRACVLYRNKNSAKGINGIAFAFPYQAIQYYTPTSNEMKAMSLKTERKVFNNIFSIMAVEKKKAMEGDSDAVLESDLEDGDLISALWDLADIDYTKEDWYVKGFEDYNNIGTFVDIPLKDTDDGFQIELPEKAWKIITDCQTMVWQKTGEGEKLRYLGKDHVGGEDENGNPTIVMDEKWVHIGGELVCYEAEPVKETKEGDVYSGKVRARLNDEEDIMLMIEWDLEDDETKDIETGHVTGYYELGSDLFTSIFNTRGTDTLKTGDEIQFIFDTCDEEGKVIKTAPAGKKIRVIKQSDLKVEDAPMKDCDIVFNGVLTDVYQRTMTTEQLEMHVD